MSIRLTTLLYFDTGDTEKIQDCIRSICREQSNMEPDSHQILFLNPGTAADEAVQCAADLLDIPFQSVDVTGMEIGAAYNRGLEEAEGEFVSFLLASSFFSESAYSALLALPEAETKPLLAVRPEYLNPSRKSGIYAMKPSLPGPKDALLEPNDVLTILQAFLIRREFLADLRFRENLHEEACLEMILRLTDKNDGKFFYTDKHTYYYREPLENMAFATSLSTKRWWYEDSVRNFLIPFLDEMSARHGGTVPEYLQRAAYYLICCKYKCNLSGRDKFMLNASEYETFFDLCCQMLAHVDNEIIFNYRIPFWRPLPRALRIRLLTGKAAFTGHSISFQEEEGIIQCCFLNSDGSPAGFRANDSGISLENAEAGSRDPDAPVIVGDLHKSPFDVKIIDYKNGLLEIDGFYEGAAFLGEEPFEVFGALIQGEKIYRKLPVARTEVYDLLQCFGVTYARKYGIHLEIPIRDLCGTGKGLAFYVKYKKTQVRLLLGFSTLNSRLLWYSQKSYWLFADEKYMLTRKDKALYVRENSKGRLFWQEAMFLAVLMIQKNIKLTLTCVPMRLLYWILRPHYKKKRIWVAFDKLYKAGDNGEYMFRYCQKQNDGIDCYYVINKDAIDCQRLKKKYPGRILYANSWKCRLICLYAEAILATHAGTPSFIGLSGSRQKYFRNLFHADNICIQHGLSVQNIASFQNRLYANTKLYCCASPVELDNIAQPVYGYEPEMLKMTGLARYDGLKDKEQKQILITPTWRKNVVQVKGMGMHNDHSNTFRNTAYFRIYNSLINDPKLIECAKKYGYRIVFLLHPAMSAQIDDYDRNDYVELVQATGDMNYEQILTESSLMVTDYSGVQYDFAYQRKPLVYYHPDELPPHYHDSGLDYETMGFGPICTSHSQLIDCLCEYIQGGCQTEEEYRKRADNFFAFSDFSNCARIYREILKFEREMHS